MDHLDIATFLRDRRSGIIERSAAEVANRRLPHYEAAGPDEVVQRLTALFDVVVEAAADKHLDPALSHASTIADERHQTGHDLHEIQRAINALEEQLWRAVLDDVAADEQGYALGVVSTILGALKDRIACDYVSHVASRPTRTLHVEELFAGTESNQPTQL